MSRRQSEPKIPDHPFLLAEDGFTPLTNDFHPFWHLEWIKTNSKILKSRVDKIAKWRKHILETPHGATPPNDGLWNLLGLEYLKEQQRLSHIYYKNLADSEQIKRILQYKVEQFLPKMRIPVLRDETLGWTFPDQRMPNRKKFKRELDEIYHQANLRQVKERNKLLQAQPKFTDDAALRAMAMKAKNPALSVRAAAKAVGIPHTTLQQNKYWRLATQIPKAGSTRGIRRGNKLQDGTIEAVDDSEDLEQ